MTQGAEIREDSRVPFDEAALTRAGERLQEFAAALPQDAQAALRVLLERGRAAGPVPHAPPPASIFHAHGPPRCTRVFG